MRRTIIGAIALAAVVAATGAWQLVTRGSDRAPAEPVTTTTPTSLPSIVSTPITTTSATGKPVDVDRSKTGAVRIAIRFLELDERLFPAVSPAVARAMTDSITSTSARKRLGDRAEAHQREILAKGDLQGLTLRLAPISTRVRHYSTSSATVDIFLLRLWSFPTKGALDDYATAEVRLVWEKGEWRLTDSSVIDGPYPVARFSARPTLASTAARFEQTLAGFDDEDLTP